MIFKQYSAILNAALEKDASILPVSADDAARLASILPAGESIALLIKDGVNTEEVLAVNECGIIILDRAQGDTDARKFPKGSCVYHAMTYSAVSWLICNLDCCGDDCPCTPVTYAGNALSVGYVGRSWVGNVVFTGSTPMTITAASLPSWVTTTRGANYLRMSGTPTGVGSWSFSVTATNCGGANTVTEQFTLQVLSL